MSSQLINITKLGVSLGAFALGGVIPEGFMSKIIEAVSGNLASNFVDKYDPEKLLEYLTSDKHELNHDIEKLMIASVPKAVELVKEKYERENPYKDAFVKNTLKSLIADAKARPYDSDDHVKMTHDQDDWLNNIHEYIFRGYEDEDGKLVEIETFYKENLAECYQLVFMEGLKDESNEKPFKALLIKSLEGLTQQLTDNAVALTDIKTEIQALKQGNSSKFLPIAKSYFNKEFNTINEKLDRILKTLTKPLSVSRSIPHHLTPPPFLPEVFLGREEELEAIKQKLFTGNHLLLLVNGEGGVGKTSLASKYYHIYEDK